MKIALLSNVNMNYVIRSLKGKTDIFQPEGYGNELGFLQNPGSTYHAFEPDVTFFVMDYMELLGHDLSVAAAEEKVAYWFAILEQNLEPGKTYYVSDADLFGAETEVLEDILLEESLLGVWNRALKAMTEKHANLRVFPYRQMIRKLGAENAYSWKTWYLGKILLSNQANAVLADMIMDRVRIECYTPKKVLVLDLDNTLWGGLAGEADHTPVKLSEDHGGLAYKNLQRVILQMQKQGVILAIVSKNNEADAMDILANHPHMLLRPDCFACRKINWEAKNSNLEVIAKELNLGLDSFVFFDDSEAERSLVSAMLPQVTVPAFPDKPEELASAMTAIYKEYFAKPALTKEDLEKTAQYAANQQRETLKTNVGSFEEYLEQLKIVITNENPSENAERMLQLLNKTNQFNLTTVRHTAADLQEMLEDQTKRVFLLRIEDRFGDNGITAVLVVSLSEKPVITEFVMSCRVMGRNVEQAILDRVENELAKEGYETLTGLYVPTAKNTPVAGLYEQLGYVEVPCESGKCYQLDLTNKEKRVYAAAWKN